MFDKLTVAPAPAPKVRVKAEPLTKDVQAFGKKIAAADHGVIVDLDPDSAQAAIVKATLKTHSAALFGAGKVARFRKVDGKLRITLVDMK